MKILLTGGAGFIGSHIVDQLLDAQHDIVIVDRNIKKQMYYQQIGVTYYHLNIHDEKMESVFYQEKPDAIIHLAAQISVSNSMKDPVHDMNINGYGTIKLLQLAVQYKVQRFIFASSAAVYGVPTYQPMDESHPVSPISFYGLSKQVGEQYIHLYQDVYHLDFTILRFANVYGPGQSAEGEAGVIAIFNDCIQKSEPLTIYGDGEQTRDFIYVKDVASACVRSLHLQGSHTINIGSNNACSLNELVHIFTQQSKQSIVTNYEPIKIGDIRDSTLCHQKALEVLEWTPKYTIYTGLSETAKETMMYH